MLNGGNSGKYIVIVLVLLVVFVIAAIGWTIANPPKKDSGYDPKYLKAQKVPTLGRNHITDIAGIQYNTNPPSSGNHFPIWAQRGVYNMLISDGYLVHSLEHGYIVMSYNCGPKGPSTYQVLKSGDPLTKMQGDVNDPTMRPLRPDNLPKPEVKLPDSFQSASCKSLVNELAQFLNTYQRIIVVPRPNMDSKIALTAWGEIDKMDTFDKNRIGAFVEAFHNKGPEQTVE